MSHWK